MPLLDGSAVFGVAVHVVHLPQPLARQTDSFFGINGVVQLVGGSRGRMWQISGVLIADSFFDVQVAESLLLGFADGLTHVFTDSYGTPWPNVVFNNDYQPDPGGAKPYSDGWLLPYRCSLQGLS